MDNRKAEDRRVAAVLLRLKTVLDQEIPGKTVDKTLPLANWNIRELGAGKHGGREKEALFYLSEINQIACRKLAIIWTPWMT